MKIQKITGVENYNGKHLPSNFRKYLETFFIRDRKAVKGNYVDIKYRV